MILVLLRRVVKQVVVGPRRRQWSPEGMITHKQVWDGIDRLAARYHLSASGLAKRAGLDPTTFNKSKRITKQGKPRWPSTESVAKVLEATGAEMSEYVGLMVGGEGTGFGGANLRLKSLALGQLENLAALDSSGHPIGTSWEEVDFPGLADEHVYIVELDRDVSNSSYRNNDLVVISPTSSVRRSDRVLARLRNGAFVFGVLMRRTSARVVLGPIVGDSPEVVIDVERLQWLARIIWVSQ